MKRSTRIAIEIFGPALLGTVLLFAWMRDGLNHFLLSLLFAYAFALIPSLVYAFLIEKWIKHCRWSRFGILGLVVLSTLLGSAAGYCIMLASEAPVSWIGAFVGLILGVVLSVGVSHRKERPNQTLEPTITAAPR